MIMKKLFKGIVNKKITKNISNYLSKPLTLPINSLSFKGGLDNSNNNNSSSFRLDDNLNSSLNSNTFGLEITSKNLLCCKAETFVLDGSNHLSSEEIKERLKCK
jgi:hypothetical protein